MMKQKMRSLCLDIMIETSFSSVARLRLYSGAELEMFSQNTKKKKNEAKIQQVSTVQGLTCLDILTGCFDQSKN